MLLAGTSCVPAQKVFKLNRYVDSILTVRYWRVDIDTNYVTRPQTKWTLMGRFNVSGAKISAKGMQEGRHFESEMKADYKSTVSIGVNYLGLSLNLSVNPAKMLGKYRDYELGFRSYGKRFGFDIAYQDARNFKGWHELDDERWDFTTSEDMFKLRTLNVNGYYVFNHRRFSYPAAFSHSYIQRRSAGSFMLAASGQGQHGKVDGETPVSFKMTNIGIGAGYGYNFVPAKGWLLHLSALPTFIVYTNTSLSMSSTEVPLHYHCPEVIITGRGAIVKQMGRSMFAGFSMVYYFTNIGNEESLTVHNEKWLSRLYFGFRL
ncbi:MAG: DUF4421 family protein [Prevotella sp.]|nr:DUF4421 family protein [Prevotella sp.]